MPGARGTVSPTGSLRAVSGNGRDASSDGRRNIARSLREAQRPRLIDVAGHEIQVST